MPRRKVSTANVVSPLPYTPICGTGDGCRANPARPAGSASSSRFFSTPAKSAGVVAVNPVPGPRCGASTLASGVHGPAWRNWVSSAGRAEPRLKTSTSSGNPLPGEAQTSARATVDCGLVGVISSPAALSPATRRGGKRLSFAPGPASLMIRTARADGTRSAALGSRMTCGP